MKNFIDDLSESFDYLLSAFTKVKPQISLFLSTIWTCISYVQFLIKPILLLPVQ